MNIQQAKLEIANTLRAYLQKDDAGRYTFPTVRQRPILLMGPPGVGKTAIMEQIAREQDVALVAYTMTHHTRQSAIGLPKIAEEAFGGAQFSVTRYTMSEIIAEVYRTMEATGHREGILFLDEINCVSETLAPTMLQFLQNKTFGNHRLPEGWLIVAAGNPPEYNKSVRDFDIVTLDRVRQMDVTADAEVFLNYGIARGLHGAVISYLSLKPDRFYHVTRSETELSFVTARGWEDLSQLLQSYEQLALPVSQELMGQFLRMPEICRDFYGYYTLYRKYGADYGVREILAGQSDCYEEKCAMARAGDFTERFAVVNLVTDRLQILCRRYTKLDRHTVLVHEALKACLERQEDLGSYLAARRSALETKRQFALADFGTLQQEEAVLQRLADMQLAVKAQHLHTPEEIRTGLQAEFSQLVQQRQQLIDDLHRQLERGLRFITDCFGDGQELTLLISGLTASEAVMDFIARHGCDGYAAAGSRLLCRSNERDLLQACRDFLQAQA